MVVYDESACGVGSWRRPHQSQQHLKGGAGDPPCPGIGIATQAATAGPPSAAACSDLSP